jgi:hypothetical protein
MNFNDFPFTRTDLGSNPRPTSLDLKHAKHYTTDVYTYFTY